MTSAEDRYLEMLEGWQQIACDSSQPDEFRQAACYLLYRHGQAEMLLGPLRLVGHIRKREIAYVLKGTGHTLTLLVLPPIDETTTKASA